MEDGGDIRGDHILAVAEADHQGRSLPESHDGVGLRPTNRHHRILTDQPWQDLQNPVAERALLASEELGDELGVGVRGELDPIFEELATQSSVVFEDSVVDHRDVPAASTCGWALASVGAPWVAHRV